MIFSCSVLAQAYGAQLTGAAKDIGNEIERLGIGFISIGGPTPPPKTSTMTQE